MAKSNTKPSGGRDPSAPPARSAFGATPAKPVGRIAAKPAAKALPSKPTPKAAPANAPAAKAPMAKASVPKALPPKPAVKKAVVPAKAPGAKAKPSRAEQSVATEAEIIGAVSGKLAARTGGGIPWLGSRFRTQAEQPKAEAPAIMIAETVIEVPLALPALEVIVVEVPAVAESAAEVATEVPGLAESEPVAESVAEAPPQEYPPAVQPEVTTLAVGPEAAVPAAETVARPRTEVPPALAAVSDNKDTLSQAAANAEALSRTFKTAINRLGWALALQGIVFAAFCALVRGGIPLNGLPYFLAGAVPLFAMGLIVAAFVSLQPTQQVLDKLESERLRCRQLLLAQNGPPDSLTNQRKLAHWPALLLLGVLFVAWLYIGLTVWFL